MFPLHIQSPDDTRGGSRDDHYGRRERDGRSRGGSSSDDGPKHRDERPLRDARSGDQDRKPPRDARSGDQERRPPRENPWKGKSSSDSVRGRSGPRSSSPPPPKDVVKTIGEPTEVCPSLM